MNERAILLPPTPETTQAAEGLPRRHDEIVVTRAPEIQMCLARLGLKPL